MITLKWVMLHLLLLIFELFFFQLILSSIDLQDKVSSDSVFVTVIIDLHKSTSDC